MHGSIRQGPVFARGNPMLALLIACRTHLECQDTYVAAGSADSACPRYPLAQARHLSYRVQKDATWDSTIGLAASPVCPSGARSIDLTLQISFGDSHRLVLFATGKPIYGCCPDVPFQDKGLGSPFLDPVTSECQSVAARNR